MAEHSLFCAQSARVGQGRLGAAIVRFSGALTLPTRTFLLVLVSAGLVSGVDVTLKALRVALYPYDGPPSLLVRCGLLASEACVCVGLLALMLAITVAGGRLVPRLAAAMTQLLALGMFLATCIAHGYFVETGSSLDYGIFAYGLANLHETLPMLAGALRPGMGILLAVVPLCLLIAGVCMAHGSSRWRASDTQAGWQRRGWRTVQCTLVGLLAFAGADRFRISSVETGFERQTVVQLVHGFLSSHFHCDQQAQDSMVVARRRGASSLHRTTDGKPYNVAIIFLESTRADATSAYVPALDTTPSLARLAREGTTVDAAYTVIPRTAKALAATLCGFEPRPSIDLVESQSSGLPGKCLPQLLREAGYSTTFFQATNRDFESHADLVRNLGFDHFFAGEDFPHAGLEVINDFGYEDAILLEPHRRWLREQAREPFMAAYLTSASHYPYQVPTSWPQRQFSDNKPWNDYLNAVSYVDTVIGKLLEQYREAGLYERTLFVVLGDHGEAFSEHGLRTHFNVLYEEGVRIPLVLRAPRELNRPSRLSGPVSQVSIVPSVLDILGYLPEGEGYDTSSIYAKPNQEPVSFIAFTHNHCLASVRDHHKFIYYYDDQPPKLYNLQIDPDERRNLAPAQKSRVQAWAKDLRAWEAAVDKLHETSSGFALSKFVQRSPHTGMQRTGLLHFADLVDWLGYSMESLPQGKALVRVFLQVKKRLPPRYHFALVLRKGPWPPRVLDEIPVTGLYPYHRWQPGDYIANPYRIMSTDRDRVREACLQLLNERNRPVEAHTEAGAQFDCAPLSSMGDPPM